MMKRLFILILALFSSSLAVASQPVVTMKTWLKESDSSYKVNEQIIMYVELATPRWFTSGTRISLPEIQNVLVKQQSQLATNFTQRIEGQTWSTQRWEVALYPQQQGKFTVPPVAVEVQVSTEKNGNLKQKLFTKALKFEAEIPSGQLTEDSEWVSSPDASIEQAWSSSSEELKVGDSITRTIKIDVQDTLSVLIPSALDVPQGHEQGYQVYPSAPRLEDKQNRGQWLASREEEVTYVLQQGGEMVFPEITINWWDSSSDRLQTLTLEGKTFEVKHTFSSWMKQYRFAVTLLVCLLTFSMASVWAVIRYYRHRPAPLWWRFHKAVMSRNKAQIRTQLYARLKQMHSTLQMREAEIQLEEYSSGYVRPWILWIKLSQVTGFSMLYNNKALPQLTKISHKYREENEKYRT
ncbi:batD protein [Vibrio ishigakensis]|uniref:BatD protein n=1 Tax=Vibrio ishigakensis TaxID=1481914 RepID=A0A0B8P0A4_9VIBR|nr:BatD family protein [Vibrio ishigakensis]GAM57977.1 batD protein [Vibrio ishigakensis]